MDEQKSLRIPLPKNADGFLERECLHCEKVYAIDAEEMDARGLRNLRCPYCGLICRFDESYTTAQIEYGEAIAQHELMKMAEGMIDDAFSGLRSSKHVKVTKGDVDLGGPSIPDPHSSVKLQDYTCSKCSFRQQVQPMDGAPSCAMCRD